MPSASYFCLPLRSNKEANLDRISKKRKRDQDNLGDEAGTESASPKGASDETPSLGTDSNKLAWNKDSVLTVAPSDAHQYRIAGQDFNEPLPQGHYPHSPLTGSSQPTEKESYWESGNIETELTSLCQPPYAPVRCGLEFNTNSGSKREIGLRRQHLSDLITLLNRLLCEGDFIRASRAYGLLLRSHGVGGANVDIRKQDYWGMGAEILFRNRVPCSGSNETKESKDWTEDNDDQEGKAPNKSFNKVGFLKARDYYERLILQYPYRKTAPHAKSALDFYPPMFGLWIYATQQEFKTARDLLDEETGDAEVSDQTENDSRVEDVEVDLSPTLRIQHGSQQHEQMESIRRQELIQAKEIAARLDELLLSPPYSDSLHLQRLQKMVSLWIGDLAEPSGVQQLRDGLEDE